MKYTKIFNSCLLFGLLALAGCSEETLIAEVPSASGTVMALDARFVSTLDANSMVHRWDGKDLSFELRQGKNSDQAIDATFDTQGGILEKMVARFAQLKGVSEYKLLGSEFYEVPATVSLKKGQTAAPFSVKLKNVPDGAYVLPLVLKSGACELGVQFVEVVKLPQVTGLDMAWLDRVPTVDEPRFVVAIETAENDLRNVGNYMLYPQGLGTPSLKRPLFDMTVIFSANMNYDEGMQKPVLYYNESVKRILDNRDIFVKPLQDKGIKVLLSVMPNHQGIGFSNLNITGERRMIKDFARDIHEAVKQYGLDGVMFDDEYADYPGNSEAEQPGRPMVQMGSFHFLVKELRNLMPLLPGQAWKDRHNLITFYNVGPFSNGAVGEKKWNLFSNHFDYIKNGEKGWADDRMRPDQKAVKAWVKDPANQAVLDEIGRIKVGELFDFIWNANYKRGDEFNYSMIGGVLKDGSWIAGMDKAQAAEKFGTASFEMSLEVNSDHAIQHKVEYWGLASWENNTPGRMELKERTLAKQRDAGQKNMLLFNLQYVPDVWNGSPMNNLYLVDFPYFMKQLGNKKNPVVKFEGTNHDMVKSSYLK